MQAPLSFLYIVRYPTDDNTYGIDTQFLWGAALLILPVLKEVSKLLFSVSIYLFYLKQIWYKCKIKLKLLLLAKSLCVCISPKRYVV